MKSGYTIYNVLHLVFRTLVQGTVLCDQNFPIANLSTKPNHDYFDLHVGLYGETANYWYEVVQACEQSNVNYSAICTVRVERT